MLERLSEGMPREVRTCKAEEYATLSQQARDLDMEIAALKMTEREMLLPWHGDQQFIGVANLLCTPLFSIAHRGPRRQRVALTLSENADSRLTYEGPELRQDDGLVLLALLNIAQEFRPGTLVHFNVAELCRALLLSYCGSARSQVRASIKRLQEGFLTGTAFRVQLIGRFNFPSKGLWSVGLDPDVLRC